MLSHTIQHEEVHKAIFEQDNCKNITTKINYLTLGGSTMCNNVFNESQVSRLSHNYNEVIGYNLVNVYLCFFVSLIVYWFSVYEKP